MTAKTNADHIEALNERWRQAKAYMGTGDRDISCVLSRNGALSGMIVDAATLDAMFDLSNDYREVRRLAHRACAVFRSRMVLPPSFVDDLDAALAKVARSQT